MADFPGLPHHSSSSAGVTLYEYLLQSGERDRDLVESRLCRFDTRIFERLGEELEQLLEGRAFPGEFLTDAS